MSTLQPHGLEYTRLSFTISFTMSFTWLCSNSCPLSWWCHPTISASVTLSFNFIISPSNEYSGLISFRIDWFDLAVQGTLKSLLELHSSKASVFQHSDFFMVKHSYPYMTPGKTTALAIWTFLSKVTSLLLNMLLRFVIAFLQSSIF